jgi:hypothetical protein
MDWNAQKAYQVHRPSVIAGVVYTIWLFGGDNSFDEMRPGSTHYRTILLLF